MLAKKKWKSLLDPGKDYGEDYLKRPLTPESPAVIFEFVNNNNDNNNNNTKILSSFVPPLL
jgi:hypothetical protein